MERKTMRDDREPGRYRKKPVTVTARRLPLDSEPEFIETLEGVMRADPGDWIITGVEGERYPCKDSVFRKTYEMARTEVDGNDED